MSTHFLLLNISWHVTLSYAMHKHISLSPVSSSYVAKQRKLLAKPVLTCRTFWNQPVSLQSYSQGSHTKTSYEQGAMICYWSLCMSSQINLPSFVTHVSSDLVSKQTVKRCAIGKRSIDVKLTRYLWRGNLPISRNKQSRERNTKRAKLYCIIPNNRRSTFSSDFA